MEHPYSSEILQAMKDHGKFLHKVACQFAGEQEADDAISELWLRLLEGDRWATFRAEHGCTRRTWLYRVLVNLILQERRKKAKRRHIEHDMPDEHCGTYFAVEDPLISNVIPRLTWERLKMFLPSPEESIRHQVDSRAELEEWSVMREWKATSRLHGLPGMTNTQKTRVKRALDIIRQRAAKAKAL